MMESGRRSSWGTDAQISVRKEFRKASYSGEPEITDPLWMVTRDLEDMVMGNRVDEQDNVDHWGKKVSMPLGSALALNM